VTTKHLIEVSLLLTGLALPVPVALAAGDGDRFASFADGAHASGTLQLTLTYSGDPKNCAAAETCGVSGKVVAKLRVNPDRRVRVHGGSVAALPVKGATSATVRDTVAGHVCHGQGRVNATGVSFKGDSRGVLLRVGVPPDGDPFQTACRAPALDALGDGALPSVRLKRVGPGIDTLRLRVNATRSILGDGYRGTLKTRGTVSLRG
jgi:hypothetical protein